MFRYLVFTYSDYYPSGGMEDCIFKTNNLDEVDQYLKENRVFVSIDNLYIYDTKEDKTINLLDH